MNFCYMCLFSCTWATLSINNFWLTYAYSQDITIISDTKFQWRNWISLSPFYFKYVDFEATKNLSKVTTFLYSIIVTFKIVIRYKKSYLRSTNKVFLPVRYHFMLNWILLISLLLIFFFNLYGTRTPLFTTTW